ncbi:hypothetical protein [Streptomyces sp. NPDC050485]|uniref:hypothetical protein n=1 Tax=Streptomyces sp. NPDC050485 TaxID=3365617 RepID=UPI003795D97D
MAVTGTLVLAYGLHPEEVTRIPQGTSTDNYAIVDQTGRRYFAKVYRARDRYLAGHRPPAGLEENSVLAGQAGCRN